MHQYGAEKIMAFIYRIVYFCGFTFKLVFLQKCQTEGPSLISLYDDCDNKVNGMNFGDKMESRQIMHNIIYVYNKNRRCNDFNFRKLKRKLFMGLINRRPFA